MLDAIRNVAIQTNIPLFEYKNDKVNFCEYLKFSVSFREYQWGPCVEDNVKDSTQA